MERNKIYIEVLEEELNIIYNNYMRIKTLLIEETMLRKELEEELKYLKESIADKGSENKDKDTVADDTKESGKPIKP